MKRKKPFFSPSDTPTSSSVVLGYYISPSGSSPLRRCMGWLLLLLVLLSVSGCGGRHDAMVERLEALQKFNQADSVFTSDSAALELANYFDAHGDANERMLAHYLLGRAYYDMGETPLALHHYHEAIESADTTDKDCDFRQLGRIHGQLSRMFLDQGSPQNTLKEASLSNRYALHVNDTMMATYSWLLRSSAYEYLNMPDSALMMMIEASRRYEMVGDTIMSAMSLGPAIDILIAKGRLRDARVAMTHYEKVEGLFDSEGNIKKGYEIYYYPKGMFYLETHDYDSARYYFRKLIYSGFKKSHFEAAYKGLSLLYTKTGQNDSALHYSQLAYNYKDSCEREKKTEDYQQKQALYNYTRFQNTAVKQTLKAERAHKYWIITILFLIFSFVFFILNYRSRQTRIRGLRRELEQMRGDKESAEKELCSLRELSLQPIFLEDKLAGDSNHEESDVLYDAIVEEKTKQVIEMKLRIAVLEAKLGLRTDDAVIWKLSETSGFSALTAQANAGISPMSSTQWKDLKDSMDEVLPDLHLFIETAYPNSRLEEYQLFYLTRAGFKSGQMASLLSLSVSHVSKIKSRLLPKLFKDVVASASMFDKCVCNLH